MLYQAKVVDMFDCSYNNYPERRTKPIAPLSYDLFDNEDLMMEQIIENINNTSIGQVLKRIATLSDVRKEKVLDIRRQLTEGKYDLSERLNVAIDKVLEDLTT